MDIVYRINTAKYEDIYNHLENVKDLFFFRLAYRVSIKDYAKKITLYAQKIEAWQNGELIGLLAYYVSDDDREVFVTNISVYERFQNKGIGASMMLQLKTIAKEKYVDKIKLECARELKILNFYKRNGFVEKNHINAEISEQVCYLKPLVAIQCFVYNHESFLRDCFEGFVMQQTNFPFVAIVHDDASTDGSAAIIREYEEKYPYIFRPIYEIENQFSKRDGSLERVMNETTDAIGVKYVAMCEGDDYWIDSLKLQKQVDFMEIHKDCVCHSHNSLVLNTKSQAISLFNKKMFNVKDYNLNSFLKMGWFTPTQSLLYRKEAYHPFSDMPNFMHGDYSLLLNIQLKAGSYLHYENEIMSVYRDEGWASMNYKELDLYDDFVSLLQYFKSKSNHICDDVFDEQIELQKKGKLRYVEQQKEKNKSKMWIHRIMRRINIMIRN